MTIEERLFSIEEVAERLGMSRYTIAEWLRSGRLKGRRIGRFWRVKENDLEAFIDNPPPCSRASGPASAQRPRSKACQHQAVYTWRLEDAIC
jgi:excisionase family DNA binding protein